MGAPQGDRGGSKSGFTTELKLIQVPQKYIRTCTCKCYMYVYVLYMYVHVVTAVIAVYTGTDFIGILVCLCDKHEQMCYMYMYCTHAHVHVYTCIMYLHVYIRLTATMYIVHGMWCEEWLNFTHNIQPTSITSQVRGKYMFVQYTYIIMYITHTCTTCTCMLF